MVNVLRSFAEGQALGQEAQARRLGLQQQRQQAPIQSRLAQLQLQGAEQQAQQAQQQQGIGQETQRLQFMHNASRALRQLPIEQRASAFERLSPLAQQIGIDPSQFTTDQLTDVNLDQSIATTTRFMNDPASLSAEVRSLQEKSRILESAVDPETGDFLPDEQLNPQQRIVLRQEGLRGRAPSVTAEQVGQRERAKLQAQADIKPELAFAVRTSEEAAKRISQQTKEKRKGDKALEVYEGAFKNLTDSLGQTFTGPGVGLIPAITENSQTAEAAIASMAPILKEVFRVSGEGVFTDKDQELLLRMIPDRGIHPEARKAILSNIDAIIRSKIGVDEPEQGPFSQAQEESANGQQTFTTSGGQTVTFTVE